MKMTFQEIRIIATGPCITNQLRDVNTILATFISEQTDENYTVPNGIVYPLVSVSALTWFIKIYLLLKFTVSNNIIIIKTKVLK